MSDDDMYVERGFRDEIALAAMVSLLSEYDWAEGDDAENELAIEAYKIADAMVRVRGVIDAEKSPSGSGS